MSLIDFNIEKSLPRKCNKGEIEGSWGVNASRSNIVTTYTCSWLICSPDIAYVGAVPVSSYHDFSYRLEFACNLQC